MRQWRELQNQVVEGKYHLHQVLGEGGFGCVFAGEEYLPRAALAPGGGQAHSSSSAPVA